VGQPAGDDNGTRRRHTVFEVRCHGPVAQGARDVFGEQGVYDAASGQFPSYSFMNNDMPRTGMSKE
jgi:carbon-monoxide dehydrogenase large subunit